MSTASSFEREMLTLINQERTSRGLEALQLETQLNDSSEDHSAWMLGTDTFSHTGSGGSTATQRMEAAGFDLEGSWRTGENIAWQSERGAPGISDDVAQLHQNLMNSPGHRANILNPDFRYIGIGIETGDMQGFDAVMVTQNFAETSAEVMLDNGGTTPPAPVPPEEEVVEPEQPVTEPPETDVTETEEPPVPETPETEEPETEEPGTDVTDTEEPETEEPGTDVTDTEEPETEEPGTDVTDTEEPETEEPGTDVTDTEEPETEEPGTDVTDTEEPETETPGTEEPAEGCFDVAAFLAEIEAFIEDLRSNLDQFVWDDDGMTPPETTEDDIDPVMVSETEPVEETVSTCSDMAGDGTGDIFVFNYFDMNCMLDAA
ncbi:CAP domain-containing protein [Rhodobacteraceae bacterium B1Z28]|uniref:CAP domain-containing protein n=1 Tax=Ruegeria haliotis TaxID=2747601 RepID=A0ABX2PWF2_9RHOB|nr:CAP domain-containing protein [Ruegeria haliotis]NVO57877.1 CAP domain-containing protein [Ruegeria haliotis]